MTIATETGYAKINLALHVRERRGDGYHAIETLFAFVDAGDGVSLRDAPGITVSGPFAAALDGEGDNLVTRAEAAYRAAFAGPAAGFALDKRLPVAAGLGGGSADAAAALRLLCRRDGRSANAPEIHALAAGLGADVPACLSSRASLGTGRGDRIAPLADDPAGTPVLLVNPRVALATGPVFRGWDGVDRGPLGEGPVLDVAAAGRNDLEAPALALCPAIGAVLAALATLPGVRLARMSGSGATCCALFASVAARDAGAAAVAVQRPDWWVLAGALR